MVRTLGTEFAHFLLGQHGETATSSETFPRPRCAALTAPRVGRSPRPAVARPASRRSQSDARKSPSDQAPGLPASCTLNEVITAIAGHAIGRARLDGTYEVR
jgi:hypothetical protein